MLDGALYRGARGWSGEIGHLPIHPDGPPLPVRRPAAAWSGTPARRRSCAAAGLAGADLPADTAAARLADLAGAGDPATLAALAEAGTALGVAVAGVVNLLDLDTVVLGGGYAPLAPWLRPPVIAEIDRRVLTAAWSPVTVRPAALGAEAAAVGAAGSVVRRIIAQPAGWLARARADPTAPATGDRRPASVRLPQATIRRREECTHSMRTGRQTGRPATGGDDHPPGRARRAGQRGWTRRPAPAPAGPPGRAAGRPGSPGSCSTGSPRRS